VFSIISGSTEDDSRFDPGFLCTIHAREGCPNTSQGKTIIIPEEHQSLTSFCAQLELDNWNDVTSTLLSSEMDPVQEERKGNFAKPKAPGRQFRK